jgi:hypothetical protein
MKYLIVMVMLLISNLAVAKSSFDGAWAQHQEDLELLVLTKPNGQAIAVLKTNSSCKPIFAKMRGIHTKNNFLFMYSEEIRLPNKCSLELNLSIGTTFSNSGMKVTKGGVTSIVRCGDEVSSETDSLEGQSFYRTNAGNFFKMKRIMEI